VLQQTPSAQKPEPQSDPDAQAIPGMPGGLQAPARQMFPGRHSLSFVHGFLHDPAEQTYGAQSFPAGSVMHWPMPSQICPLTTVPWQSEAPQEVPRG
jgi:hypothetical protein